MVVETRKYREIATSPDIKNLDDAKRMLQKSSRKAKVEKSTDAGFYLLYFRPDVSNQLAGALAEIDRDIASRHMKPFNPVRSLDVVRDGKTCAAFVLSETNARLFVQTFNLPAKCSAGLNNGAARAA